MRKPKKYQSMAGMVRVNIQLPQQLYDTMKTIRQTRHELEGSDVKLCRIYREAVEQYIKARPQQELLTNATTA